MNPIEYNINESSIDMICQHLNECSESFIPALTTYIDIDEYSKKLFEKSLRFEAYIDKKLVGLIAAYINDEKKTSFITNVSVDSRYQNLYISKTLMVLCLKVLKLMGCESVELEVFNDNSRAINFYKKNNFIVQGETTKKTYLMKLDL